MNSTISADIIASTALSSEEMFLLSKRINDLFLTLKDKFKEADFFGRMIKGDYIECYVKDPKNALRIALMLKSRVKSFELKASMDHSLNKRRKIFKTYGIRIAIGVGPMRVVDFNSGIIDGEAIYLSGRKIAEQSSSGKDKVVIKNTLFFEMKEGAIASGCRVIVDLLDNRVNSATTRQCEILYYKLLGLSEAEIAAKLSIKQSGVNQHSSAVGWNSIEHALTYYEQLNFE
ncbi:MAG: RNA polymerase subunit sigma-70 [Massilibacteroides sp.]|nr:RNA polymerase subunit sigma-70 [Massilibacteroides sp.]